MSRLLMLILLSLLPPLASASVGPGRLAAIEVVDRHSGRSLPVYRHHGQWYVAGEPGREYEIRVRSRRSERLLAVPSVDGVNVVTGQTAAPQQSGYVLAGYDSVHIEGWRKSLERVARFYFTDLGDSYAARTGRPDHVGVIGVALFQEREQPRRPWLSDRDSADAQAESHGADAPSAGTQRAEPRLGTGHGQNAWSQARYTTFERASEQPQEIVTIYYDSRRNLVAQGVIPREREWARRQPQPFPAGFVPDPW